MADSSPYYPPRARWYGPLYGPWFSLRRACQLERLESGLGSTLHGFLLAMLLPGYSYWRSERRGTAAALAAAYPVLGLIFLIGLGHLTSNVAFAGMIAIHVTSILYELFDLAEDLTLSKRIVVALLVLGVMGLAVYQVPLRFLQERVALPINAHGRVIVIRPAHPHPLIKRGDWVAYSIRAQAASRIVVNDGIGFAPILAMPDDQVRFGTNFFEINGVVQPTRPWMPTSGELIVQQKQWFIWPEMGIANHNVADADISGTLLSLAQVPESDFIGTPYKRWFGRSQTAP